MNPYVNLLFYLTAAAVGGLLGEKTKLPAGTLLGAVLAVVVVKSLAGQSWSTPRSFNFFSQVVLGVLIALAYTPGMFKGMGVLVLPMLASTLALVAAGVVMALAIRHFGFMDMATAYIATSPGGMSALVPMAVDMNVNVALIGAFHFFRVIFVVVTAPMLFKFIIR